jgi:hypothetical protein
MKKDISKIGKFAKPVLIQTKISGFGEKEWLFPLKPHSR